MVFSPGDFKMRFEIVCAVMQPHDDRRCALTTPRRLCLCAPQWREFADTLLLLLFASTKFCDFGIPTILRVLIFAISRTRAKFCDFAQPIATVKPFNFEIH